MTFISKLTDSEKHIGEMRNIHRIFAREKQP
jgi:hypothetical protein